MATEARVEKARSDSSGSEAPRGPRERSSSDPIPLHPEVGAPARLARIVSICVATMGIVATAPVMIVVALLVKLTSPGPVFYVQERVGVDRRSRGAGRTDSRRREDHGGRIFTIYKFRTMHVGSDKDGQVWATRDDRRVTSIGRFLRSSRLDELPQLFNVLLGDMNIVGPRPEQPAIFRVLREQIEDYPERQKVLPGITGLAQVNQSYDEDLADVRRKVGYDLEYIRRKGPIHDLWIMAKTFPVVLKRLGW